MIATIVLTATFTAAVCLMLSHKRNSYIHCVEQTSLERGEEIAMLRAELTVQQDLVMGLLGSCRTYRIRLKNAAMDMAGATASLIMAREHAKAAEARTREVQAQCCALTVRAAMDNPPIEMHTPGGGG